jgi:hypothetical protein
MSDDFEQQLQQSRQTASLEQSPYRHLIQLAFAGVTILAITLIQNNSNFISRVSEKFVAVQRGVTEIINQLGQHTSLEMPLAVLEYIYIPLLTQLAFNGCPLLIDHLPACVSQSLLSLSTIKQILVLITTAFLTIALNYIERSRNRRNFDTFTDLFYERLVSQLETELDIERAINIAIQAVEHRPHFGQLFRQHVNINQRLLSYDPNTYDVKNFKCPITKEIPTIDDAVIIVNSPHKTLWSKKALTEWYWQSPKRQSLHGRIPNPVTGTNHFSLADILPVGDKIKAEITKRFHKEQCEQKLGFGHGS